MTVNEVLSQITVKNGIVTSKSSGKEYEWRDFLNTISKKLKWTKKQIKEFESHFVDFVNPQSDKSRYIEDIIDKYEFKFSDGVYFVKNRIYSLDEIYRFFWKNEKLLPTETNIVIENVEKISEPFNLQDDIFNVIKSKARKGKSLYLDSLRTIYPNINWENLLYNIICPNTKPMFHIFYDDGVGGTGKSTLLEVLTKVAGEKFVSNVLLDQFGNRFIFANMLGKYLNIGDDNGRNDELQNVGTLKSIVTGNRVTVDRKNISPIEVRIFAKQLFATNILPYIDFTDGGLMRRLNIVCMNKVIPKSAVLPVLDEDEIGHFIYEVYNNGNDLDYCDNDLAITSSPIYRFFKEKYEKIKELAPETRYLNYCNYCDDCGFRKMNIINFENKLKFVTAFEKKQLIEVNEDLPF